MIDAFPLTWPDGRRRIDAHRRQRSRFDTTLAHARDELVREIRMLDARNVVVSSNLTLRQDGLPYAQQREPEDPGVAAYFQYGDRQMCFACDKWDRVRDNLQAVRKTIGALRGIARWGPGDMMFTGFLTLPAPGQKVPWRQVLGFAPEAAVDVRDVDRRFRELAAGAHPGKGGDSEQFQRLLVARNQGRKALHA